MKKVVLKRPTVPSGEVPSPPPPPPPPPPLIEAAPPMPAAPTTPVEPPPEVATPTDFDGWMKMALAARPPRGQLAYAQFFATMAQNAALKQIADELNVLNDFAGAYDDAGEDEDGDETTGEQHLSAPLRLADQITEGILGAVSTLGLEQVLVNAKGKA